MDIHAIKLVYFSPTQTTKKVLESIAAGIQFRRAGHLDLTPPTAQTQVLGEMHDEWAIIGAPVYAGRIPEVAARRLRRLRGNDTPAVIVVVYGNREYEDALLELRDIAVEAGFRPVAGGAFIGEHSFSTEAMPLSPGRPDGRDVERARAFGRAIQDKMRHARVPGELPPLQVPGNAPYRDHGTLPTVPPITQAALCMQCEACIAACPTAAITAGNTVTTDPEWCIMCCACVKICPSGARITSSAQVAKIVKWLSKEYSERREPEVYL